MIVGRIIRKLGPKYSRLSPRLCELSFESSSARFLNLPQIPLSSALAYVHLEHPSRTETNPYYRMSLPSLSNLSVEAWLLPLTLILALRREDTSLSVGASFPLPTSRFSQYHRRYCLPIRRRRGLHAPYHRILDSLCPEEAILRSRRHSERHPTDRPRLKDQADDPRCRPQFSRHVHSVGSSFSFPSLRS